MRACGRMCWMVLLNAFIFIPCLSFSPFPFLIKYYSVCTCCYISWKTNNNNKNIFFDLTFKVIVITSSYIINKTNETKTKKIIIAKLHNEKALILIAYTRICNAIPFFFSSRQLIQLNMKYLIEKSNDFNLYLFINLFCYFFIRKLIKFSYNKYLLERNININNIYKVHFCFPPSLMQHLNGVKWMNSFNPFWF